jgi:DNA-binding HxlR family transcriptional regulator
MDKLDVEILWTLKQSPSQYVRVSDMVKNNKKLSIGEELKEKLRFLEEDGMIESQHMSSNDIGYAIKKKGSDLIWNGEIWEQIFNLIKLVNPEKYTSNEIRRITNKSLMESVRGIEYLRKERKLIDGQSQGFKLYFILSEKGKSYNNEIDS